MPLPELVSFLQQHIAEQKRFDATLSGGQTAMESSPIQSLPKEAVPSAETIVVLPNDLKKQRKGTKGLYSNKGMAASIPFVQKLTCVIFCSLRQRGSAEECALYCTHYRS